MNVSFKLKSNKKKSNGVHTSVTEETKFEPVTEIAPVSNKRTHAEDSKLYTLCFAQHRSIEEAIKVLPDAPTEADYESLSIEAFGDYMRAKLENNEKRQRR